MITLKAFEEIPIIGILRGFDLKTCVAASIAAAKGGVRMVEITTDTPGYRDIVSAVRAAVDRDVRVGVGTVRTTEELDSAMTAGAEFIVTPVVCAPVIEVCVKANLPIFPGAFSPTEIWTAHQLGATAVKVFPAGSLGVSYVKDLRAPLNGVRLLPTGQVTPARLAEYLAAGAFGCGVGSTLFLPEAVQTGDWPAVSKAAQDFCEVIRSHRNG